MAKSSTCFKPFFPAIIFSIAGSFLLLFTGCNRSKPNYSNNREPLLETTYMQLPLGAVKPLGWLYDQLVVQKNGLTSHLNEVWDVAANSAWKGDTGMNVTPECCTARYFPRWLEGLIPMAWMLDDDSLKNEVMRYMNYIISVDSIPLITPSLVAWSHLGRVLPDYYEITGDKRTLETARRIFEYANTVKHLEKGSKNNPKRLGMLLNFSWWYYNETSDPTVFALIDSAAKPSADDWREYFSNFEEHDRTGMPDFPLNDEDMGRHGVDVAQAIQYTILYYLYSKDESYKNSVFEGIRSLDTYNGQVGGRWNADEYLAGLSPVQGTELCDITELVYALGNNFESLGDVSFADRSELLIFNGLPGTCTADMWAHQYDQQANQVLVSDDERPWKQNTSTSNVFGFTPHFPCCLSNMHSPLPRYIRNMWFATSDRGLIAHTYGPSVVQASVGKKVPVEIVQETSYPFDDQINFTLSIRKSTRFPLYFRIPAWANNTLVTVNDSSFVVEENGTIIKIEREWNTNDQVSLKFNHSLRTEFRLNNAVSLAWGPLYFSLKMGQNFKQIEIEDFRRIQPDFPVGVANWHIDATTPWNYALILDPANPQYEMIRNPISSYPFARKDEPIWLPGATNFVPWPEDVPLTIKMKARQVKEWGMNGANAAPVPLSPLTLNTPETEVELIPYGCTRLRISEFPWMQATP
jgi:hypothetical protein